MKKFKFKLQTVLNVKNIIEEQKKKEFGLAKMKLAKANLDLDNIANISRIAINQLAGIQSHKMLNLELIKSHKRFIRGIKNNFRTKSQEIDELKKIVLTKQNEYIKALKEKKIMEKLKEKYKNIYDYAQAKTERKFLDEIAITQVFQKKLKGKSNG